MQNIKKDFIDVVKVIILAVILTAGISYAWTGPTNSAPYDNISAPINIGATPQFKLGGLYVGTGEGVGIGFAVVNGSVGIGTVSPTAALTIASSSSADILSIQNASTEIFKVQGDTNVCINGSCVKAWGAEPRTSDPTNPVDGQMWLRTDL